LHGANDTMTDEAATPGQPASEPSLASADAPPSEPSLASAGEPPRVVLHMPVDVRSLALFILTALAAIFALQWARSILVPILLGVMFSYALTPLVDALQRGRVPRPLGAGLVVGAIVALIGWGAWSLSDDASALIETLPQVAQKVRQGLEGQRKKPTGSPIDKVQQAANELEQAAQQAVAASAASAPTAVRGRPGPRPTTAAPALAPVTGAASARVARVVVERPAFNVRDYLLSGTIGLLTFFGELLVVLFVTLFLLASGDTFRRKMVKLAGPRLSQKKITVQALDEVSMQIQRYLLVQLATSVVVGIATGTVFFLLGLNNAAVWGVAAGITNLVPYVGAVLVGLGSAVVGFIQFDSIDNALLIGASSFAIHALVGNLLTPWWTGRASRMSPFAVFVGVLTFGWLWGAVGLILGTPILMVVKAVCDRIDELKPVGEFLGA
jgi:predicted PurR-regulated permease PerM